jgi:hypothetical protein
MFKNPIAPKIKDQKKKSPWDFRCPPYDERTSCYVNAGSHFGVGFKNPVGHKEKVKSRIPTLPFGRIETMRVAEVPVRNLPLDIKE